MGEDSSLREMEDEETKCRKRRPRFKEERRCVIAVERKFPSLLLPHHFSFLLIWLACTVSLQHASLIKGKGVGRLLKLERKAFHTGKGAREAAEEGKDDETRRQRVGEMWRLIGMKEGKEKKVGWESGAELM